MLQQLKRYVLANYNGMFNINYNDMLDVNHNDML